MRKSSIHHCGVRRRILFPYSKIHISLFPKNITMQVNKKICPNAEKPAPFLEEAQMLELLHRVSKTYILKILKEPNETDK
jgi:hypothetical protein